MMTTIMMLTKTTIKFNVMRRRTMTMVMVIG